MRLELVVVLYPSLLLEEGTFFISEIVEPFVQGTTPFGRLLLRWSII
jgi:hypothetical protein